MLNSASITPTSFGQDAIFVHQQLNPGDTSYNEATVLRLSGTLDVFALSEAFESISKRHEILRTTFCLRDGRPVQVIDESSELRLRVDDFRHTSRELQEGHIARAIRELAYRPFDLSRGPLCRASLFKLSSDQHILVVALHHIIVDGWSMGLFARELEALYSVLVGHAGDALLDLPVQYRHYAEWQRQTFSDTFVGDSLHFWQEYLKNAPERATLPSRKSMPTGNRAKSMAFTVPEMLVAGLRRLARQERATLFLILLATFQVLLRRYGDNDDILVSTIAAGRIRSDVEALIGDFTNPLPLRARIAFQSTFREVLRRTCQSMADVYAQQDLPFPILLKHLRPQRNFNATPFLSVLFRFDNFPKHSWRLPGLTITEERVEPESVRSFLDVSLRDTGSALTGKITYNAELFEPTVIEGMACHYRNLLEAVANSPGERIQDLALMEESERRRILEQWNARDTGRSENGLVHELFEAQVTQTPDAVALVFKDHEVRYRELNERANAFAHFLIERGVGPETVVGVCMRHSVEAVIALLAILKAGGAYLPLDPRYPVDRLTFMAQDSAPAVMVVEQSEVAGKLSGFVGQIVELRTAALSTECHDNPSVRGRPGNAAYLIYTSGSTGRPKGVIVEHRNVRNYLDGIGAWVAEPDSSRTWLAVTSLSFDISVTELLWTLTHGYRVVLCNVEESSFGSKDSLAAQVRKHSVSHLQCTPSLAGLMASSVDGRSSLQALSRMIVGGEVMSPALATQLKAILQGHLLNMYGPTETTVWSTAHRVDSVGDNIPIGRPLRNTQIYILDGNMQPVPAGVPGELHIGGDGVARAYHGRPGITAERFIPDPFSKRPGARLYRTGDTARYLPDGDIEFLGRRDNQVKIRGHRVEIGEIEAVLREHPRVREVAVSVTRTRNGKPQIESYVVPDSQSASAPSREGHLMPIVDDLRHFARQKLPEHMVPASITILPSLPRAPGGKIDRSQLPAPVDPEREAHNGYRTPLEEMIGAVWADVLEVGPPIAEANFFDLGGDSLLALQAVSRISEALSVEVPGRVLFENPTIRSLAAYLTSARQVGGRDASPETTIGGTYGTDGILTRQRSMIRQWRGSQQFPDSFVFTLNQNGSKRGLFWAFQAYMEYAQLAAKLGPDQPLHGMRSGHMIMDYTYSNVDALAAQYASEIIKIQSEGPLVIGGNCQGAIIAQAVATKLQQCGRYVALLFLMEPPSFERYCGAVALLFGSHSRFNPYRSGQDAHTIFRTAYPEGYVVEFLDGAHGQFFTDRNIGSLVRAVRTHLA